MKNRGDSDSPEADRIAGVAHPRETYDLIGHDEALARVSRGLRAGKPPQALLLTGPLGIGKATLGYRIARYLLRFGASADGPDDLALPRSDIVSRQIEAQSHPGLLVLKRGVTDKDKLKTVITVDEIRKLAPFFGMTAEAGGWRVAIVDSADEMNDNAANALLKVLEEPPPRGMLILISHAPGRLLPTIRSRCRRLDLKPLADDVLVSALEKFATDLNAAERESLMRLAHGSLGAALRLKSEDGLELANEVETLLSARGTPDHAALLALADRVARKDDGLRHFGQFLGDAVMRLVLERAKAGEGDGRGVALLETVRSLNARAVGVHMEPRQTVMSEALTIARARRRQVV